MITLIEFVEGFHDPARRIQQALAGRVFADIAKQGFDPRARPRRATDAAGPRVRQRPEIRQDPVRRGRPSGIFASGGFASEGLPGRSDLINASMSTPFDRSHMDRSVTGRGGGLPPDARVPHSQRHSSRIGFHFRPCKKNGRLYFRHSQPYIGRGNAVAKGDRAGEQRPSILC